MKHYIMAVEFRDYYNEVVETKVETTDNFKQAMGAFEIYMEHPECRRIIWAEYHGDKLARIIASFQI